MENDINTKPWLEQVKPDFRGHEALKDISDVNHLVETHITTMGEVSKLKGELEHSIKVPGESASEEERSVYRKAIGIPEKADEYEIPIPKGQGESVAKWAREVFFKAGIPKEAAPIIANEWNSYIAGLIEQREAERQTTLKTGMEKLKTDWGDKYDGNVEVVKRVQGAIGKANPGMGKWLADHNAENDPTLVSFIFSIAPAFLDDSSLNPPPSKPAPKEGAFSYPDM